MPEPDAGPPSKPPVRAVPIEKVRAAQGKARIAVPRGKVASTKAFRRVRSDRAFGLVGVLLVVLAIVLLFTWPQPPIKKPPTFSVAWPTSDTDVFDRMVQLNRTDSVPHPEVTLDVAIGLANATRVTLNTTWRDDVGDQLIEYDNATFELTKPGATNATLKIQNSATSKADLTAAASVPLATAPNIREVPAATLAEARAKLGDRSAHNGTGTWKLHLRLDYVGDHFRDESTRLAMGGSCPQNTPAQGGAVCVFDPGNKFHVKVTVRSYRVDLEPSR